MNAPEDDPEAVECLDSELTTRRPVPHLWSWRGLLPGARSSAQRLRVSWSKAALLPCLPSSAAPPSQLSQSRTRVQPSVPSRACPQGQGVAPRCCSGRAVASSALLAGWGPACQEARANWGLSERKEASSVRGTHPRTVHPHRPCRLERALGRVTAGSHRSTSPAV